ncbi:MAG: 16S rRNA (adenine(1518)-N(6)/adenine(1519)-N(6))-dimethyltransferase RsmA [Heliobacteriaceae bacterium]|nr:16S rRNA (adenine(1518)-N(6)/adenine(1519)-N(6))-dimethyltransferase RsmA [Heliobacteriaceae bacterium]MDD4587621.1 16S rRNA (adenine(1518)-N(6)/adenine(1519)-N(6))-dimethyltransferase RsmA [Heliobacteriaceae bacterium]
MHGEMSRLLAQYGLKAKKGLGQNFLTDPVYLQRIVAAATLAPGDVVVEIGPGTANLTRELGKVVGPGGKVIAVELDTALQPLLTDLSREYPQVEVVWQDALQVDYTALTRPYRGEGKFTLVANLPYYIATPLVMYLLTGGFPVSHLVVMVQKEVADRMVAGAGGKAYGVLSVAVQYYALPILVTRVPPGAFLPRPKVDSAVVRLDLRIRPAVTVADEAFFFRVVRAAFNQRRKTLLNALAGLRPAWPKAELGRKLDQAGIDPRRRGETLNLEEFARVVAVFAPGVPQDIR